LRILTVCRSKLALFGWAVVVTAVLLLLSLPVLAGNIMGLFAFFLFNFYKKFNKYLNILFINNFTFGIIYLVILFCVWFIFIFNLDLFQVFFSDKYDFFYCYLAGIPIIPSNNIKNLTPVKYYSNGDKENKLIYDENKGKCGVYCWTNLDNNKCYVGGSSNHRSSIDEDFLDTII